jgi:hypothetical protein
LDSVRKAVLSKKNDSMSDYTPERTGSTLKGSFFHKDNTTICGSYLTTFDKPTDNEIVLSLGTQIIWTCLFFERDFLFLLLVPRLLAV